MEFFLATFFVLFIGALVAFLLESRKSKKLKGMIRERNKRNQKQTHINNAVFQNIHAYILVIDRNSIVLKTNFYQRTGTVEDKTPKRVGDLLCCQNAIVSGKCGTHINCEDCVVNKTITEAFKRKEGFAEMRAELMLAVNKDEFTRVEAIVSGAYIHIDDEECMVLTIHDITELARNRREKGKLVNVMSFTCALSRVGFASLNLITKEETVTPEYLINLNEKKDTSLSAVFADFHYVYPEYRQELLNFIENAHKGEVEPLQKEVKVLRPNNTDAWIKIFLIQKDYQPQNNINEIYSLVVDITHRKEVETNLALEKERAEESNKSKSTFLANMSHEIRTPLNAIMGFSELLANASSEEEKKQFLGILKMNNEMLLQLINDILDLSKIEAGTLEFKYSDIDLNVLMGDLEQQFRLRLPIDSQVKMIFEPALPKHIVYSDRSRLGQVLSNFLSNAIKFTEVGTIRIGYKLYENGVYCYVSDTGAGMKKEMVETVFNRFARFHRDKKGNGLGMAISKTIIEKLGGTIGVESVYQKGSTFYFILPDKANVTAVSKDKQPKEKVKVEVVEQQVEKIVDKKQHTILIATAEDEVYDSMQAILFENYEIKRARTGEEAIMIYFQDQPRLIFMALQMPEVDGYQATEAIRQMSSTLPIIALADEEPEDKGVVLKGGFSEVLTKPVSRDLLVDTVSQLLK